MALKVKKGIHRAVDLDGHEYYARANPHGYGYEITKKISTGDGEYDWRVETYFRHNEKLVVRDLFDWIIEHEKLPTSVVYSAFNNIPEKQILKIVIHETKHHTYHYRAESEEELEKVLRKILKEEYEDDMYYNPFEDTDAKNKSGFETREEIEALPDGKVKEFALKEWEDYENFSKTHATDMRRWKELEKIVKVDWGKLGNVERVIFHFEGDRLRIEDVTIVE